jgi:predicted RNA-binding protein
MGKSMSDYWLVVVTEENYHTIRSHRVYGVPATRGETATRLIKPGDIILVYVAKRGAKNLGGRIAAAYRVKSEWRREETPLWPDEERENRVLYPYRVDVEPLIECTGPEAPEFKELVPSLSFIEKKDRWQAYLVGTIANARKPIPREDAEKIIRELEKRCKK